jgi:hypothetical protein
MSIQIVYIGMRARTAMPWSKRHARQRLQLGSRHSPTATVAARMADRYLRSTNGNTHPHQTQNYAQDPLPLLIKECERLSNISLLRHTDIARCTLCVAHRTSQGIKRSHREVSSLATGCALRVARCTLHRGIHGDFGARQLVHCRHNQGSFECKFIDTLSAFECKSIE